MIRLAGRLGQGRGHEDRGVRHEVEAFAQVSLIYIEQASMTDDIVDSTKPLNR